MNTLITDKLTYNKSTKTFITEASDLSDNFRIGKYIHILNPKTGVKKRFQYSHKDTDAEGEIQGWNYVNKELNINLLIIND